MKRFLSLAFFLLFFSLAHGQAVKVYEKCDELQQEFLKQNDTTYVLNFWATWCKPCVAELPYFVEIKNLLADQKIKFLFVSLDFKDQLDKRVVPFLKTRDLDNAVYLLADQDSNTWIPKINGEWSGAIPATAVYKNGKQVFFAEEGFESTQEIKDIVTKHL